MTLCLKHALVSGLYLLLVSGLVGCSRPDPDDPDIGCLPNCRDRECGEDPRCGESCGDCSGNEVCNVYGQCECEPDCSGLECGWDPNCGEPCGECVDGPVCTEASCEDGRCVSRSVDDGVTGCFDWLTLEACVDGEPEYFNCAAACLEEGVMSTMGCLDAEENCSCVDWGEYCTPDETICLEDGSGGLFLAYCADGAEYGVEQDFWYVSTCHDVCISSGFGTDTGECGPNESDRDVCFCCDPDCGGAECGDDGCGGSCGSCPAGEDCVSGRCQVVCPHNNCRDMAGSYICQDGRCVCAPGCQEGSVCCGEPFCAGDCLYSSCC